MMARFKMATSFEYKTNGTDNGAMSSFFQPGADGMSFYAQNKIAEHYQALSQQQNQYNFNQVDMAFAN